MTKVRTWGAATKAALTNPFAVMLIVVLMYSVKAYIKIAVGGWVNSPMITGDGYHNIGDLFEALAVMAVIYVAKLQCSERYPFGRKNIEFFTSLLIGAALLLMSARFAVASAVGMLAQFPMFDQAIRASVPVPQHQPLVLSNAAFPWMVIVTAGSVFLSFVVSRYQIAVGKETGHPALVADGEETGSDMKIEIVTLLGVLSEYIFHAPWIEYPLALVVAVLIGRTGHELFVNGWRVLLQHSIDSEHETAIKEICRLTPGVVTVDGLKTFQIGPTAVVMLTLSTELGTEAIHHIKYGIEYHVRRYFKNTDFKDVDLHFTCQQTEPDRHRVAFALTRSGETTVIARDLASSTHLVIADVERGRIVRTTEGEKPAKPVDLFRSKRVKRVYTFYPSVEDSKVLEAAGIELKDSTSFLPSVMGLTQAEPVPALEV